MYIWNESAIKNSHKIGQAIRKKLTSILFSLIVYMYMLVLRFLI